MMKMKNLISLYLLLLLAISCGSDEEPNLNPDPDPESIGDATDFQKMVTSHALSTFQEMIAEDEDNILLSPLSLQSTLYMVMNGSANSTLEEFRTALKSEVFYPSGMNPHYQDLMDRLTPKNGTTALGSANAIFYDDTSVDLYESYEKIITNIFAGELNATDFSDPATLDRINDWAKDKTEGRIDKVLDEINSDEVIFLMNALYFKADWEKGFEEEITRKQQFVTAGGQSKEVDMMMSDDYRRIYRGEDYSAVDLKLTDDEYAMTFILPKEGQSPAEFVNGFGEKEFYEFYLDLYANKLEEGRIMVNLPKFELKAKKKMNDILNRMGLTEVFQNADFSRMGEFQAPTYLSRVLHDAYLKIDEKGVEGAAVTTAGVAVTSLPPSIDFNRPFIFVIRHVETNTPIFMGKVGDPS